MYQNNSIQTYFFTIQISSIKFKCYFEEVFLVIFACEELYLLFFYSLLYLFYCFNSLLLAYLINVWDVLNLRSFYMTISTLKKQAISSRSTWPSLSSSISWKIPFKLLSEICKLVSTIYTRYSLISLCSILPLPSMS